MNYNISQNIKSIREKKGWTQEQVAEKLNMTRSNYARLEQRNEELTISQISKIAQALCVELKEILGIHSQKALLKELIERTNEELSAFKSYVGYFTVKHQDNTELCKGVQALSEILQERQNKRIKKIEKLLKYAKSLDVI